MPQQPFTPEGVSKKITELYDLSEPALQAQASAAKANFSSWLQNHFLFTIAQSGYLSTISSGFMENLGQLFSLSLGNRLPISLIEPFEIDPNDYSSKIISTLEVPTLAYNQLSDFTVTGSLSVSIALPD